MFPRLAGLFNLFFTGFFAIFTIASHGEKTAQKAQFGHSPQGLL